MENKMIIIIVIIILLPVTIYACSGCSNSGILNNKKKLDLKHLPKSIYDYSAISIDGKEISINQYKGKKILIVNVASKCGFTPQYAELQELQSQFEENLVVLGFPSNDFMFQEPGDSKKIKEFCTVNYGITFQLFDKIVVKNNNRQHPIYTWLSHKELNGKNDSAPSWNFCKYLLDENGDFIQYFNSRVKPLDSKIVDLIRNDESY
jgi:glutathione peroxidase